MANFEVGDVVQLKSGGPIMTVQETNAVGTQGARGFVSCAYFDGAKKCMETFVPQMLEKYE